MNKFQRVIKKYRDKYNQLLISKNLLLLVALYLILVNLFFVFHIFTTERFFELFVFGLSLKIFLGLIIIYFVLQTNNQLINQHRAARFIDNFNEDKNDTYQNALELWEESSEKDKDVLELIYYGANQRAESQKIEPDKSKLKNAFTPFLISVIITFIFLLISPSTYRDSWHFFSSNKMPQPSFRDYVIVSPGDISILRNTPLTIEVIDPEPNLTHTLYFKSNDIWRSEALYQNKKTFSNPDFSFHYYVTTPHAVSDTFYVQVFEEPSVRDITLRYNYPAYSGLEPETEYQSSGNIRGLINTRVTIEIETNNPLEEALLIFSDGSLITMERLGRTVFEGGFTLQNSGTYHLLLTDFLGNQSRRLERPITVIPDKVPEIKIIYPGRDTIFTQNMMQRMKFFATDDFGLKNLKLHYHINENEPIVQTLRERIAGNTIEQDYVLDLSGTYMLPGDRIVYWVEISDNAPTPQTATSQRYVLRFPSIEEIFAEIEREEEMKMESFRRSIEISRELQQEFEQKRREMMKREEFDWEDRQELEQFLQRQDDLNQQIDKIADEYQQLLEKFEDNPSLSQETLEKMERIRDLMEEIADERLRDAMEKMRQAMEEMSREDLLKAMENLKFSMEEFDRKLQNTIDLLENIKKEQSIQKALAISQEMEQMQEALLDRTQQEGADGDKLAQEQDTIKDKLDALKDQLQETMDMLDEEKDRALKDALSELQEQMQADNLEEDLEESMQSLQNQQMSSAVSSQQQALQKMQKMSQKLSDMAESMMTGSMSEMASVIQDTIRRLLALSEEHQNTTQRLAQDPFPIYPDLIAGYDAVQIALQLLYSSPQIILYITPKFIMDADMTLTAYREMFNQIINTRNPNIRTHLNNVQKGMNLMIFNLMQTLNNMDSQQGPGGGMESMMQAMQMMGQEQMAMNMITQQLLDQMGGTDGYSQEMRQQMQRLARDEERLAENLRRLLETNPEAQRQANAINQLIEELESVARQLRQNRLDESLIRQQERILSRMLDAQKSINQREFSRQRRGETREEEDWTLPPDIQQEFQRLRQRALLEENYRNYPPEYQELIREYLRLINIKALERE
ncbi:MAG: hypothetical protein K0B81_00565 [Candidatus Cloacimonetes bacterium]|nr:hypothetical protein [Candidatus Cloacimonadota bacterium]